LRRHHCTPAPIERARRTKRTSRASSRVISWNIGGIQPGRGKSGASAPICGTSDPHRQCQSRRRFHAQLASEGAIRFPRPTVPNTCRAAHSHAEIELRCR
jgi:hypothetical protein